KSPALERSHHTHIEEVELGGGQWLALPRHPPRRHFLEHQRIPEDLEILVDRRPGDLGVVCDVGEVSDGAVTEGGRAQEPAESGDVAGGALRDDFLLEIGSCVSLEVGAGVVREVDRRQRAPLNGARKIKADSKLPSGERMKVPGTRPTAQQVDTAPAEL